MAYCKLGHVYIVPTVLTKPPKSKFAICVCPANGFFVWINSKPRPHGKDQMPLKAGCHPLVTKDCFLDLSRVVQHPTFELDDAREFDRISTTIATAMVSMIRGGLFVLPAAHAEVLFENLRTI
ncbi:hypothetical protein FJ970_18055 [Mesorhizobium sp. B2-1-8]|uniref:hypothetical protein n=1 Tax=Mesorhizobium sp. B2-1-8 TaxID=2589967 RepID=UPI00112DB47E|nr:hypothetical protein [Mesorhizobium sp. B2-1-8]UCI17037.1 hypothetical protein FJ970_18055 [Mesorhizobium sp. B2-1-8]